MCDGYVVDENIDMSHFFDGRNSSVKVGIITNVNCPVNNIDIANSQQLLLQLDKFILDNVIRQSDVLSLLTKVWCWLPLTARKGSNLHLIPPTRLQWPHLCPLRLQFV